MNLNKYENGSFYRADWRVDKFFTLEIFGSDDMSDRTSTLLYRFTLLETFQSQSGIRLHVAFLHYCYYSDKFKHSQL